MKQNVLQNRVPYTYLRNGVYYFCIRTPRVLLPYGFPSTIRFSLHTTQENLAKKGVLKFKGRLQELGDFIKMKNKTRVIMEAITFIDLDGRKFLFEDSADQKCSDVFAYAIKKSPEFSALMNGGRLLRKEESNSTKQDNLTIKQAIKMWLDAADHISEKER